ncbi:MAG: DNA/RNA non-specific endonuclease [Ignavibacteria bacterium]|jgi:endonuclease G|nr:DNA/RNA non-specific endonuclease [Ignavibacteria bacterium]
MNRKIYIYALVIFAISQLASFAQSNINISAGMPVKQGDSVFYIIDRPQYVISISKYLSVANWAAWHLDKNDYGKTGRTSERFITDTTLPIQYYRATHSDYTNSGYDRGHLVPSNERTSTKEANNATFYLTNIVPQTPDLNRLVWYQFEKYCKTLAVDSNYTLYIVAGGVYNDSSWMNEKIAIPDSCWKVALLVSNKNTLSDVDSTTQTIAIMMPNINGLKGKKWTQYITSVRNVEKATGYDFFNALPINIQDAIETKVYKIKPEPAKKKKKK